MPTLNSQGSKRLSCTSQCYSPQIAEHPVVKFQCCWPSGRETRTLGRRQRPPALCEGCASRLSERPLWAGSGDGQGPRRRGAGTGAHARVPIVSPQNPALANVHVGFEGEVLIFWKRDAGVETRQVNVRESEGLFSLSSPGRPECEGGKHTEIGSTRQVSVSAARELGSLGTTGLRSRHQCKTSHM